MLCAAAYVNQSIFQHNLKIFNQVLHGLYITNHMHNIQLKKAALNKAAFDYFWEMDLLAFGLFTRNVIRWGFYLLNWRFFDFFSRLSLGLFLWTLAKLGREFHPLVGLFAAA